MGIDAILDRDPRLRAELDLETCPLMRWCKNIACTAETNQEILTKGLSLDGIPETNIGFALAPSWLTLPGV